MLIYVITISGILLSMFAFAINPLGNSNSAAINQDALGQIISTNLKSEVSCNQNLEFIYDSGTKTLNLSEATSAAGQEVKVKIPQFEASEVSPSGPIGAGTTIAPLNLTVNAIRLANVRLLGEGGGIKTYHGTLIVQTKSEGYFARSLSGKPAVNISIDVNASGTATRCFEDERPQAMCSRYGGIYNETGTPQCTRAPVNISCPADSVLTGVNPDGTPNCQSYLVTCPSGNYFAGLEANGSPKCLPTPTPSTGTGSKPQPTPAAVAPGSPLTPTINVWKVAAHSNQMACPKIISRDSTVFVKPGEYLQDGIEGTACYSEGFKCRETICFSNGAVGGYFSDVLFGFTCGGLTKITDKQLECSPGTPTKGPTRIVPSRLLRISGSIVATGSFPELPYCYPDFVCTAAGNECWVPGSSGLQGMKLRCENYDPVASLGHMVYTRSGTIVTTCTPATDPNDPYGLGGNWCMKQATGLEDCDWSIGMTSFNPFSQEGLVCHSKPNDICWRNVGGNQYKVLSCR